MSERTEVTLTPTREVFRVARLGTRRLSRAHLAVATRPSIAEQGSGLVAPISRAVGEQLAAELTVEARLLEGAFVPRLSLPKVAGYAVLELSAAGASAVLEVELPFLISALARVAGASGKTAPASAFTRLEEAAFGLVVLVALGAVRRQGAFEKEFAPRLSCITTDRAEVLARLDDRQAHLAIELRLGIGEERGLGRLLIPARTVQVLAETFPPAIIGELAETVRAATIPARAYVGTSRLTGADAKTLQPGDVVLFEDLRTAEGQLQGQARIATRLFDLIGELGPSGFVIHRAAVRAHPEESLPMSQSVEVAPGMPPLPVEVEVELTRLRLSVSELATLRQGSLVPLHINSSEPVVLRVGDRAVARAELVEIEGEVGARILALLP